MKLKRITALALSAIMAFSICGCGKEKANESKKVDTEKLATINDAIDVFDYYKKGEFTFSFDVGYTKGSEEASVSLSSVGDRVGGEYRGGLYVDYNLSGRKLTLNMVNAFTKKGDRLYFDFDRFFEAISDADTELGSYGFLAPEVDSKKQEEYNKELKEVLNGLVGALLEGAEVSGSNGEFTAKIQDGEGYKKAVTAILKYIDENREKIDKLFTDSQQLVDLKSYTEKAIDDMKGDLVDAAEVLGIGLTKDGVENFKKNMLDSIDSAEKNGTEKMWESFDSFKQSVDELSDDEWKSTFTNMDNTVIEISVAAKEDSYDIHAKADVTADGASAHFDFKYSFANKDVKIEKPSNVKSLKEMAEYLNENQSLLQSAMIKMYSQSGTY